MISNLFVIFTNLSVFVLFTEERTAQDTCSSSLQPKIRCSAFSLCRSAAHEEFCEQAATNCSCGCQPPTRGLEVELALARQKRNMWPLQTTMLYTSDCNVNVHVGVNIHVHLILFILTVMKMFLVVKRDACVSVDVVLMSMLVVLSYQVKDEKIKTT